MHRFFIPPSTWDPDRLALDADETHHCTSVLRCREGEKVVVFNGEGAEATATITAVDGGQVSLSAINVTKSPPLPARLTLGQAVPKGKTVDLIIQKATELGASRVVPLLSERTVVQVDPEEIEKKASKWQRVAVEACKQSGQNWLPTVDAPTAFDRFFASPPTFDLLLIASLQPDARHLTEVLAESREMLGKEPSEVLVLIGPEGDFTPAEVNLARSAGCQPIGLGPIVLRTETAAIYCLSVLGYELFRGATT